MTKMRNRRKRNSNSNTKIIEILLDVTTVRLVLFNLLKKKDFFKSVLL